jgi:hypothetical protein
VLAVDAVTDGAAPFPYPAFEGDTMSEKKLKLEKLEVETFETAKGDPEQGTVEANALRTAVGGTCQGQTGLCTGCPPIQCY